MESFGIAAFEEEASLQGIAPGLDEEIAQIYMGKEFGLIRTTSGKVQYQFYLSIIILNFKLRRFCTVEKLQHLVSNRQVLELENGLN